VPKKKNILNQEELEAAFKNLNVKVLPEMFFGNSYLKLSHRDGLTISFNAMDAIREINQKSASEIKVAYSKEWLESKQNTLESAKISLTEVHEYDWTFSTLYQGTFKVDNKNSSEAETQPASPIGQPNKTNEKIDIEKLKRPDPILYYNEIVLYEDELSDNGCSTLTIKLRVMPGCFFILMKFFLRIDHVLFRTMDTRIFHEYNTNYILREYTLKESGYNSILHMLPPDQPTKITDINLVSSMLSTKGNITEKIMIK